MLAYVIRRILYNLLILFGIIFVVFAIARLSPIDPVKYVLQQSGRAVGDVDPVEYARMRNQLGLDRPILVQFADYLGDLLRGDLGVSIVNQGRKVSDILGQGLPVSLQLSAMALAVQFAVGTVLGTVAASRQNSLFDRLVMGSSVVAGSIPALVWGVLLLVPFAVTLRWFPIRGWDTPRHWVLPVLSLAAAGIATYARFGRGAVLEQIRQDFVRTAHAKGLNANQVLFGHVLRNAMVPIVTFVGPAFAATIFGNFVIETMFSIPGIAFYAVRSSITGDYPVIQATVMLFSIAIMTVNLVTDVLYGLIDPRIRVA
jgi:ABC-type dipeptide/oligopeptide/nickel transport system permease component